VRFESAEAGDVSHVWLASHRMTQTEAALRTALLLMKCGAVGSDVIVTLTGAELSRQERPVFPVEAFLRDRGCPPIDPQSRDWRGTYTIEHVPFTLTLRSRPHGPDIQTSLADGRRLAIAATAGPLRATKSSTEHKLLRSAIGRIMTDEEVDEGD